MRIYIKKKKKKCKIISQKENRVLGQDTEIDIFQKKKCHNSRAFDK